MGLVYEGFGQPLNDLVTQWAGVKYKDGTGETFWTAGYTRTGVYVVCYAPIGGSLSGGLEYFDSEEAAKAKFTKEVKAKTTKGGYHHCDLGEGRPIPNFLVPFSHFGGLTLVPSHFVCGWWEPALQDSWLCVLPMDEWIHKATKLGCGGLVKGGVAKMQTMRIWNLRGFQNAKERFVYAEDLKGWGKKNRTWVNRITVPKPFLVLPLLQMSYSQDGEPSQLRGVLRFGDLLYALWLNSKGTPVGWEVVDSVKAATQAHTVNLTEVEDRVTMKGNLWDAFEAELRAMATLGII